MTTIEHLKAARALIEKGWCQFNVALTGEGYFVSEYSKKAERFCAVGALYKSCAGDPRVDPGTVYDLLLRITLIPVPDWNDTPGRTKADVLALFDKAIALEESKGGHNE